MENGIILIDKPAGMTSFGVVARIKRVLSADAGKKVKVGHTGTLDPFATGLMIIVVGKECKNAESYSKLDKVYEATICLGKNSSTGDTEGEITKISESVPAIDSIKNVFSKLTGEISQIPPNFSAIKINGKRAYKMARAGEKFEIPARKVTIFNLELIGYNYPFLNIRTHVSSGTYIRTLAEDIGEMLGTGAHCSQLRRISVSKWNVADAKQLSDMGILD